MSPAGFATRSHVANQGPDIGEGSHKAGNREFCEVLDGGCAGECSDESKPHSRRRPSVDRMVTNEERMAGLDADRSQSPLYPLRVRLGE